MFSCKKETSIDTEPIPIMDTCIVTDSITNYELRVGDCILLNKGDQEKYQFCIQEVIESRCTIEDCMFCFGTMVTTVGVVTPLFVITEDSLELALLTPGCIGDTTLMLGAPNELYTVDTLGWLWTATRVLPYPTNEQSNLEQESYRIDLNVTKK